MLERVTTTLAFDRLLNVEAGGTDKKESDLLANVEGKMRK